MRPLINRFNWGVLWGWVKPLLIIVVPIFFIWLIWGCAPQYPVTPVPLPSRSQLLIDQEVERINKSNEAYRKLRAAGCDTENNLHLVSATITPGIEEFIYECKLESGTVLIFKKLNGKWIIHTKTKEKLSNGKTK